MQRVLERIDQLETTVLMLCTPQTDLVAEVVDLRRKVEQYRRRNKSPAAIARHTEKAREAKKAAIEAKLAGGPDRERT
jgi:hypothetical protein